MTSRWEINERKHIFVLSSSGKPIFSKYGDEQELATTFGLLQAVISIAKDSGDMIRCIRAGQRTIVYFFAQALYFVSISSTGEPESVLIKQLHFMYQQILLVLTAKVHSVFKSNPSTDIRQLLGPDTVRLMHAACADDLTPVKIVFESMNTVVLDQQLRGVVIEHLRNCVEGTGAALGMLIWEDKLVGMFANPNTELMLHTSDLLLLAHFVIHSGSLRANDQHWLPICMPGFNENGFLQAYVSGFDITEPHVSSTAKSQITTEVKTQLTLIMVAASADPEVFKELMAGKTYLEGAIQKAAIADKLLNSLHSLQNHILDRYLESSRSLHFLYKLKPLSTKSSHLQIPTQYLQSAMRFPLDQPSTQESVWIAYERLAVRVRRGSCTTETTYFPTRKDEEITPVSNKRNDGEEILHVFSMNREMKVTSNSKKESDLDSPTVGDSKSIHNQRSEFDAGGDVAQTHAVELLSSQPSSDHALAYTILSSGILVIALATYESELYVTFPSQISPMDACTTADLLSRNLKSDVDNLFQTAS